jgi:hypothetical protein
LASVSKVIAQSAILSLVEDAPLTPTGATFSLETKPFVDIFTAYDIPTVAGGCDVDGMAGTLDFSGCTLADLRVKHLLYHTSGLDVGQIAANTTGLHFGAEGYPPAASPADGQANDWEQKEVAMRTAGVSPFFAPPGVSVQYSNTEYQLLAWVVKVVSGMDYDDYLASITGPLELERMRFAQSVAAGDPPGLTQSIPYSYPMPFCYGGTVPSAPNVDNLTTDLPFAGSGAMAASPIDLMRWTSSFDGTRSGYRSIGQANFHFGLNASSKPYYHGGYIPGDTHAGWMMRVDGISFAFAGNADSLHCFGDSQTPSQTQWTHALGSASGVWEGEVLNDLTIIFDNCGSQLPDRDDFGDFLPEPRAVCQDVPVPAGPSCTAAVTPQQVDAGSTSGNANPPSLSLEPPGPFGLGPNTVTLSASNGTSTSTCSATITVGDVTPPVIVAPNDIVVTKCDAGPISLGTPSVSDNCGATFSVHLIATNGVVLTTPIPIFGGQAVLGPGVHTIRYSATDGVTNAEDTQLVTVTAAIQASASFILNDGAVVRLPGGAGAGVFNSGYGATLIGENARSGGIVSLGATQVLDEGIVEGSIVSSGGINVSASASVSGSQSPFTQLAMSGLPGLPTFPPTSGSNITVNSGQTQSLTPGSRPSVTVNSGGTLVLGAGDYFFQQLTIQSNSTVRVNPSTRVFVSSAMAFRSPFRASSGTAIQPIQLGYAGSVLLLEAVFNGTLVAPNASVAFGASSGLVFTGAFYARAIEVRAQSQLVCQTSGALAPATGGAPPPSSQPVTAVLVATADWGSGYCVDIRVTNNTASPTTTWTATLAMNQSTIANTWGGNFSGASTVTVVPTQASDMVIAAGSSKDSVGFCANRSSPGAFASVSSASGSF